MIAASFPNPKFQQGFRVCTAIINRGVDCPIFSEFQSGFFNSVRFRQGKTPSGKTVIHVKIVEKFQKQKSFKNEQSQEVDHSFVPNTQLVNHV